MSEEKSKGKMSHNLMLDNRKSLSISGVSDVDSFDEQIVVVYTDIGELTIKGKNLHINKLNIDVGEMQIEGQIDSLVYNDNKPLSEGGLFSRLFK